jgi:hypothetical protein
MLDRLGDAIGGGLERERLAGRVPSGQVGRRTGTARQAHLR